MRHSGDYNPSLVSHEYCRGSFLAVLVAVASYCGGELMPEAVGIRPGMVNKIRVAWVREERWRTDKAWDKARGI